MTREVPWYASDMPTVDDRAPQPPVPPHGRWWSDEPQMESHQHVMQMLALIETLRWHWRDRHDFFCSGNLTIYYSAQRKKSLDFRGPDFFVALGVDRDPTRLSWVVWEEDGKYPDVIVEIVSDSTEHVDRGEKMDIYSQIFRTPEYFIFDPRDGRLDAFRIVDGRYQPIAKDADGRCASRRLGLAFGVVDRELRFFTTDGELIEKPEEVAETERRRADAAEAEVARLRDELARLTR